MTEIESQLHSVLDFWFGDSVREKIRHMWFTAANSDEQRQLDSQIRNDFGTLLPRALAGEFDKYAIDNAKLTLATIIVLDQFSRHVHRGDAEKIAPCDAKAVLLTEQALAVCDEI